MSTRTIGSARDLETAVARTGLLPFFAFGTTGLSVEEMVIPGMLFSDDEGGMGAWDWKGPVVRTMECIYGKFFKRKAGFVALDLVPDFLNYRRGEFKIQDQGDIRILQMIRSNDSMMASDVRKELFGVSTRKGHSIETNLTRLQMAGYIVIADFEYNITRQGEPYGWGKARYTTPEALFGNDICPRRKDFRKSFESVLAEMMLRHPDINCQELVKLI